MSNTFNFQFSIITTKFRIILTFFLLSIFLFPPRCFSQLKIGIALPLFEDSDDQNKKQLGEDILNGITFALNEYNRNPAYKIQLDIQDTRRDPIEALRVIDEFSQDSNIICVLGPVFSSELSEVSNIGFSEKLPIISPTATGDDLAETHDYIFQLNPSYKVRGKLMASYMMKSLGFRNFGIIAEETYGSNFSRHFEDEVTRLGGKVLVSSFYKKDAKNISDIVKQFHQVISENDLFINPSNLNLQQLKKLESAGVRYSLLDSLINLRYDVSIYFLLGKNAKKIIDTLNIKPNLLKSISDNYIQGILDAIYIPISNPSEISMIVPELYSNKLSFSLAGTGDWNNVEILKENKMYLKNLVFESEYFPDESNAKYTELKNKLSNGKYKLNKSFLFGYDALNLLLHVIASGNISRGKIYETLKKVSSYDAIKSKISLDFNRINTELNILGYENGLRKIASYKYTR